MTSLPVVFSCAAGVAAAGFAGWALHCKARLRRVLAAGRYRATHDSLTGLCNWTGLYEAWAAARQSRTAPALAVLDMDVYDDQHGYYLGDELLIAVANRLTNAAVGLPARLGGYQFAVILPGPDPAADALRLADAAAGPVQLASGATAGVTIAVGLTLTADRDLSIVLGEADAARYQARDAGAAVVTWSAGSHPDRRATARC